MTKKYFLVAAALALAADGFSQKLTVSNTTGADSGSITDQDLYSFSKNENPDGSFSETNVFAFGDRFQLDYSSKLFSARGRLGFEYDRTDDSEERFVLNPEGYVYFTPVRQAGFFFGNSAFKKFVIPSSYLAASDDYTKYGRLITDSVYHEEEYSNVSGDFYIPEQTLTGAFTSSWRFGKKGKTYLNLAAGSSLNMNSTDHEKYALDFGVNYGINKLFDTGITGRNLNAGYNMKWGAFAGLKSVENLTLNGSFFYNFTSDDYLPEDSAVKSDDETGEDYYDYKFQKTLFALGISGGYYFKKAGLGLYADFISGLNSKYVADVKYYLNGDFQDSEWKIVDRGDYVKYKEKIRNGVSKTTGTSDGFSEDGVPFYFMFRGVYDPADNLSFGLNFKLRSMFNAYDATWITLYPNASVKLPSKAGEISTGLRLDMNAARSSGITGISVPLTYTYKFSKQF